MEYIYTELKDIKIDKTSLTGFDGSYHTLMYYHTSIRNVGLYTSLSLAGLAASRHYVKQTTGIDKAVYILFLSLFLIFSYIAIQISRVVIYDMKHLEKINPEYKFHDLYKQLPLIAFYVNSTAFTFGIINLIYNLFKYVILFK